MEEQFNGESEKKPVSLDVLFKLATAPASVILAVLFGWEMMVSSPERDRLFTKTLVEERVRFSQVLDDAHIRMESRIKIIEERCYVSIEESKRMLTQILKTVADKKTTKTGEGEHVENSRIRGED